MVITLNDIGSTSVLALRTRSYRTNTCDDNICTKLMIGLGLVDTSFRYCQP